MNEVGNGLLGKINTFISMKHFLLYVLLFITTVNVSQAQKKTPDDFLGYPLGSHYTPHQKVVDYYKYLAEGDKNIRLISYGKTYEGRELLVAVVSAPQNMEHLEEIQKNNLALSKGVKGAVDFGKQPAILWMSYNVHGNEASSTETAMKTLYMLTAGQTKDIRSWLKNTVVVLDPCLNPDGRERYVNFFNSVSGMIPDPSPEAREHREPWPRGRVNHYYYDLNRDWAWQTQKETVQRLALYRQWMPEVHVDFHEQNYNDPYYFAPAAEPVHQDITPWQRAFQVTVGKNNAKYFDEHGWQYFTKERFDLLYPSYGDTYPLYNGAIGMTYEQGGINAGLSVVIKDQDTLTLKDRIDHHFTTGMSTLEVVSLHAAELVGEFKKYFEQSVTTAPGPYQSYIITGDEKDKIEKMTALLDKNGIVYSFGADRTISGYNYETQLNSSYKIKRNDLIVNMHQPSSILANVLLEPKTLITDSNTYDITAWALPYAFGVNAYATKESVKGSYPSVEVEKVVFVKNDKPYAWIFSSTSLNDIKVLMALQDAGIKVRMATVAFQVGETSYAKGTLLVYRAENEKSVPRLSAVMVGLEDKFSSHFQTISSGFVNKGNDLGSSVYEVLKAPKIAVVSGSEISSQSVGQVWHFFEQELNTPVKMISMADLSNLDLSKTNVLILPDGEYPKSVGESLESWVNLGGKVILMEGAISAVEGKKPFEIKRSAYPKVEISASMYSNRNKDDFSESIPGAIYKISLDRSHPLTYGLGKYYYTLETDDKTYEPLKKGYNIGMLKEGGYVAGIAGKNVRKRLTSGLVLGVQSYGKGSIVYLSTDVLFRSFWENGKKLFVNAVFLVN
jgi:hypothetical protein